MGIVLIESSVKRGVISHDRDRRRDRNRYRCRYRAVEDNRSIYDSRRSG